jgi:hypothetical protein
MKSYEIEFPLSSKEKIVVALGGPLKQVHLLYRAPIFFVLEGEKFLLRSDILPLRNNLEILRNMLCAALHGNILLPESIKTYENTNHDIGYRYNEYLQEKLELISGTWLKKSCNDWYGNKYRVWGHELQLWLYNDDHGAIIFKLTPIFPGGFPIDDPTEPEEVARAKHYSQWIKTYKPFLTEKLPREVAQQWLAQVEEIIKTIEDNDRRMAAEFKASQAKKSE